MEFDSHLNLICAVRLEWANAKGVVTRNVNYKTATLCLVRNDIRDIFIEIRPEKGCTIKLRLKDISVYNRFMTKGKSSIMFREDGCVLFMSNAPATQLINFLKTIFVKMTGQTDKPTNELLRNQLLSNKCLGNTQEISPATTAEIDNAKKKAGIPSRATITTPSPSGVKKRKLTDNDTPRVPRGKKLYANPTVGELTDEQTKVLEAALSGKNIFFTGSAGTGKSFLLKRLIAALPPDSTVATASTGVAACHIGGITLHQFAGMGIGSGTLERCCKMAMKSNSATLWRKTKHLVIDEISMVDADFFDKLDAVAKYIRRNERPFGGIQLILCGDFLQLPPVSKGDDKVKFCFQSEAWNKCVQVSFELKIVHRQTDPVFVSILNSLRIGKVTEEIIHTLKETTKQKIEEGGILATKLCSHIKDASDINSNELERLPGAARVFVAQDSDVNATKTLDQQLPVAGKIELKVGAQVMLLKNINIANGLVNGARGVVIKFADSMPVVQFRSGTIYKVQLEKWSVKTIGGGLIFRKQIPLKLAWAFSIHKSQGLTLDCVEMSLGRVFDAGQAYVALSRAQSLKSLRVLDFNARQVWANPVVLEFYRKFRKNLQEMEMIPLGRKNAPSMSKIKRLIVK